MAYLRIISGRPYLFRCVRRGGRPVGVVVARGQLALDLAREEDERRAREQDRRRRERQALGAIDRAAQVVEGLGQRAQDAAAAELESAGFRRHPRSPWRFTRA